MVIASSIRVVHLMRIMHKILSRGSDTAHTFLPANRHRAVCHPEHGVIIKTESLFAINFPSRPSIRIIPSILYFYSLLALCLLKSFID